MGAGAATLAIIALAGVLPTVLCAIATIAVGTALLVEGGGIAARYEELMDLGGPGMNEVEAGGMTTEMVGGVAGIALGILALIGLAPWTLMAVSAIVFGGTHIVGSGTLSATDARLARRRTELGIAHRIVAASSGGRVLVGVGIVTLGILALVGVGTAAASHALVVISMLAIGGVILLSGSALGIRMARLVS